jgi:hypothetical protein
MPVCSSQGSEGPKKVLPAQTSPNVIILCDIDVVITVDKFGLKDRKIDHESHQRKSNARKERRPQSKSDFAGLLADNVPGI